MKGYIFLTVKYEESENKEVMMMQCNGEFIVMKTWSGSLDSEESVISLVKWIGDPMGFRYVAESRQEFDWLMNRLTIYRNQLARDFIGIVKSRYYNLLNEMSYKLKCPRNFTVEDYLEMYGLLAISNGEEYLVKCLRLHSVANAYHTDMKRTTDIVQKGYRSVIRGRLSGLSLEELMDRVLKRCISLQFKLDREKKIPRLIVELEGEQYWTREYIDPKMALVDFLMIDYENLL